MKETNYRIIGYGCLLASIALSVFWCFKETGLTAKLLQLGHSLLGVKLKQISCVITFIVTILPGYIVKRYCDQLAWDAHVNAMPPPDVYESAKKSKYINLDAVAPAPPKPIEVSAIPQDQAEFIATCGACGHLFPAKREGKSLRCPNCGENIPLI